MIRDLQNVKDMFVAADALINKRPELLSMHIDQIFDELDDGTSEMIHVRWGVMVRAKMTEIKSFCNRDILEFLTTIKERNLLCEYIGYVLQEEYKISLVELLLDAYEVGLHDKVLPFVEPCLQYEMDCHIDKMDIILSIVDCIEKEEENRFIYEYSELVLKTNNEEFVFEKYINNYSETLELLVKYLIKGLFPQKEEIAKKWLDKFMIEDKLYCKKAGICFLHRSLFYNAILFEKYFEILEEQLCVVKELWEQLISVYVQYIEDTRNILFRSKVKDRLVGIKNRSITEKRICIQAIGYRINSVSEYPKIIEEILEYPFDKDIQILKDIDCYFDYLIDDNLFKSIELLYKVYEINGYSNSEDFLDHLPRFCKKLYHNQDKVLKIWWDKYKTGSDEDFFLSVEIFRKIINIEKLEIFWGNIDVARDQALDLLEGISLFIIEEKKIAYLAFVIAAFIKDNEFFAKYCIDNIFINYLGALVDEAKKHIESDNYYKKCLANSINDYYQTYKEKMKKGYSDKDFIPPTSRIAIYKKINAEQKSIIMKQADEQSFLARYFPSKKMKFGKRIGLIQTVKKGKYYYNVSEYASNTLSYELPKNFINDPIRYVYLKFDYLERRRNAINS